DAGNRIQLSLDFPRVHIEATTDDEILHAADDGEIPGRVDLPEVAALEPAIRGKAVAGLVRVAPVTGKDIGDADPPRADPVRVIRVRPALLPGKPHRDPRQGRPD